MKYVFINDLSFMGERDQWVFDTYKEAKEAYKEYYEYLLDECRDCDMYTDTECIEMDENMIECWSFRRGDETAQKIDWEIAIKKVEE